MKEKNGIKQITLALLYCFGQFLILVLGPANITWFVISLIPFVLVYVLMRFWYRKAAKIYGIVHLIMLGAVILISDIILPSFG